MEITDNSLEALQDILKQQKRFNSMEEMFAFHMTACNIIFPNSTETSCLHHAVEEITEIWKESDKTKKPEEYVDTFMCLLHGMSKDGISVCDFSKAFSAKIWKNVNRKWKENADGSYSHI